MDYYFGVTSHSKLTFFGPIHITLIAITILTIFLIYKYKDKLKTKKDLTPLFITILLLNIVIYVTGGFIGGNFDINFHIPLQYCYITGFIYIFMLLTKKIKLYNFLYYAIFFCTIAVIIFMDPYVTYDRYHFILMIISHHFLLISSFYTLFVKDYPVNKNGILHFFIYSFTVYGIVFIINSIFGTTYIFQKSFPEFMYEYFPFMKNTHTLIWFIIFSVPMLIISYYLSKLKKGN